MRSLANQTKLYTPIKHSFFKFSLFQPAKFLSGSETLNIATTTTDEDGNTAEPTDPPSTISTSTHSQGTNAQGYPTPPPMPGQDPSVWDLDFPLLLS